jgi:hypothetical protein
VPAKTNEDGGFAAGFAAVCKSAGDSFDLVSYDAGAASRKNATLIVKANKHYLLRVNKKQKKMLAMIKDLLLAQDKKSVGQTEDGKEHNLTVRRLYLASTNRFSLPARFQKRSSLWPHTRTVLRVETVNIQDGSEKVLDNRYFCSSIEPATLTAEQWLATVRQHWGVEVTHNILDVQLKEDDHPMIRSNPRAAFAVMIIRRIAYTLLTLFRSVTPKSEESREQPWATLLRWLSELLRHATQSTVKNLRVRREAAICP